MEKVRPFNANTMDLEQEKKNRQLVPTSHTDRLSDTAEVVREVSKKIGIILAR